jgi:hypothetical protein
MAEKTDRHEARLRQRVDEAAVRRRDCEMAVAIVREILFRLLLLTTGESHEWGIAGRGMPVLRSHCLTTMNTNSTLLVETAQLIHLSVSLQPTTSVVALRL